MKKRKLSKRAARLKAEHDAWVKSKVSRIPKHSGVKFEPPAYVRKELPPLSNAVGNGFKRSVDDYKWKRGREESTETIKEIEKKRTRLAPVYAKGPIQYLTEDTDPNTLGKKV